MTLINVEFYYKSVMPIIAEWAYLWLQKAHLHGVDRTEAIRYLLEGAAAKSETVTKLTLIDLAITKALVSLGEVPPEPPLTLAHTKSLSAVEIETRTVTLQRLQRQNSDEVVTDNYRFHLLHNQVKHLKAAKEYTDLHRRLVDEIYKVDDDIDEHRYV